MNVLTSIKTFIKESHTDAYTQTRKENNKELHQANNSLEFIADWNT